MRKLTLLLIAGASLNIVLLLACTSKPKASEDASRQQPPPASTALADQFDGSTYCVETFMQGPAPPQPLHFSYKVIESDPTQKSKDFEVDLSSDKVAVIYHDKWLATDSDRQFFADSKKFNNPETITRTIDGEFAETTVINHYSRSDPSQWTMGSTSVSQGGTPWGLFLSRPPVNRVGEENINGYDTIRYAVDTTHSGPIDKAPLLAMSQMKDYNITGMVWVAKDAKCVLQYNLDYEQDGKDGKVTKTDYEGTVTKK
jgi:hypothetical protein